MAEETGTLSGKVALITGSGRGMGRAHAILLAEHGADIVVHDIARDGAAETGAPGGGDTGAKCPVTWFPDIIRAAVPVSRAAIITSIMVKEVGWVCSVI